MSHRLCIALIFLSTLCAQASAEVCGDLKIVASVPMLQSSQRALRFVPVHVDGVRKTFLLDTGGALSQVSQNTAHELGLRTQPAPIQLYNMFGDASGQGAVVNHFTVGNLQLDSQVFEISPDNGTARPRPGFASIIRWRAPVRTDGVLAPDLMDNYDIELDFGNNTLNYLSQDHCEGKVVYWRAPALAVVPMQFSNLQITIPVNLDGHPLMALIDTGAPHSIMSMDTADTFGLTPDAGLGRNGRLGNRADGPPLYTAKFKLLTFEGVKVINPAFDVIPDVMREKSQAADHSSLAVLPQLLLGMDILSKLHLYIAFREKKIYITEAGP